jgi:hypothetical protein
VTEPEARQRLLPDAEIVGGKVSFDGLILNDGRFAKLD